MASGCICRWDRGRASRSRVRIACFVSLQLIVFSGSTGAMASCNKDDAPNFAQVPMKMAVVGDADSLKPDSDLQGEIDLINRGQDNYELTAVPTTDPQAAAAAAIASGFKAVVILDNEIMSGNVPKYNGFLFTYRNKDLSNQTMIIDYRFDNHKRIGFAFLQIVATSEKIRSLLMEVALMALAGFGLITDQAFLDYYYKLDALAGRKDALISSSELQDVMEARRRIVLGCLLRY